MAAGGCPQEGNLQTHSQLKAIRGHRLASLANTWAGPPMPRRHLEGESVHENCPMGGRLGVSSGRRAGLLVKRKINKQKKRETSKRPESDMSHARLPRGHFFYAAATSSPQYDAGGSPACQPVCRGDIGHPIVRFCGRSAAAKRRLPLSVPLSLWPGLHTIGPILAACVR